MSEPLKNIYNQSFIHKLSRKIKKAYPRFNQSEFSKLIFTNTWSQRELKDRMHHISLTLGKMLPSHFPTAVNILKEACVGWKSESFELMILPDFVEIFGRDHWHESIAALETFTSIASSEFAVRPFIKQDTKKMQRVLLKWSKNKNYHIRRLASEGCRPRLPWAMALSVYKKSPELVISILENLKNDSELYVRRSVANNLNDISKDNPQIVLKLLKGWIKDSSPKMNWLIKHALRTLEKQGNLAALKILGFSKNPKIEVKKFNLDRTKIKLGDKFEMSLEIKCKGQRKTSLLIDYIIFHVKANKTLSPKVFKWSKKHIMGGGSLALTKKHWIKKISTRKYYSGTHEVHIQINGKVLAKSIFSLNVPK